MPLYPLPQIRTDEDGWAIYHAQSLTDEQRAPLMEWCRENGLDPNRISAEHLTVRRTGDGYIAYFNEVRKDEDDETRARQVPVSSIPSVTL